MPSIYSKLTTQAVDYLTHVNLQHKNKFELLIAPKNPGLSVAGIALEAALVAGGIIVPKLYAQKINISFPEYETEDVDGIKIVKDVKHPDTVEVEFLEDEKGTVIRLLTAWQRAIGSPPSALSNFLSGSSKLYGDSVDNAYDFASNIQQLKRTFICKLIGANDGATALFYPSFFLSQAFPKKIGDYELSQDSGEVLMLKCTFSVDTVFTSRAA